MSGLVGNRQLRNPIQKARFAAINGLAVELVFRQAILPVVVRNQVVLPAGQAQEH